MSFFKRTQKSKKKQFKNYNSLNSEAIVSI